MAALSARGMSRGYSCPRYVDHPRSRSLTILSKRSPNPGTGTRLTAARTFYDVEGGCGPRERGRGAARLMCSNCADGYPLVYGRTVEDRGRPWKTVEDLEETYRHESHGCRCGAWKIWRKLKPDIPQVCAGCQCPVRIQEGSSSFSFDEALKSWGFQNRAEAYREKLR